MNKDLEQQLQALLDKQAIYELINAYCNAADRHDNEKMRALYHEDAIDEHGHFFVGNAMAFINTLPEIQVPMKILHHNVTTVNIKLQGDYAEGEVYIIAMHKIDSEDGPVDLLIGGRYFDKYEKRDGVWKFLHRAIDADWAHLHNPSIINLDEDIVRGAKVGRPGPEDPSYQFFSLFKWGER
jgi:hypothetical protein